MLLPFNFLVHDFATFPYFGVAPPRDHDNNHHINNYHDHNRRSRSGAELMPALVVELAVLQMQEDTGCAAMHSGSSKSKNVLGKCVLTNTHPMPHHPHVCAIKCAGTRVCIQLLASAN